MNPNSAYELIEIQEGVDYSPSEQFTNYGGPGGPSVSAGMSSPVFALFCIESSGVGNIKIRSLGNDSDITIPAAAFKQGVVYYMYLKELVDDNGGAVKFVGYKYKTYPMVL